MPETIDRPLACGTEVTADIDRVCLLVPPLWELDSFVAVNPFLGFSDMPIEAALRAAGDALDANTLPSMAHYASLWRQGVLDRAALVRAAAACRLEPAHLEAMLGGTASVPMRERGGVVTRAEAFDRRHGTHWESRTRDAAAAWCARHVMRNEGSEPAPGLYAAWLEDAALDRALEVEGLAGLRAWVRALPRDPARAITDLLDRLEITPWDRQAYLYRLLAGVHGWASHVRRWAWAKDRENAGMVRDVLAIRVALDAAVVALAPVPTRDVPAPRLAEPIEDERVRLALQQSLEDVHAHRLAASLVGAPGCTADRPALQAAFCIDVRSEVMRRHLEACAPGAQTIGFAGFFGVAVRWQGIEGSGDRCPVLVRPSITIQEGRECADHGSLLASLLRSPGAAFPAVETLGLGALAALVHRAFRFVQPSPRHDETLPMQGVVERAMAPEARLDTAASMLAAMGMRDRFARLVLLCGHQGRSENNPHAAGLDCGACGGHGGALNARIAARLLNDASVREGLASRGFRIPADTRFVAAIHETSTDEVRLLDEVEIPASHAQDVVRTRAWLATAGVATRRERAGSMGMEADGGLAGRLARRAGDWSQTRPEWALARNAFFVAARRARTTGLDLQGRAFLHDYDASLDRDLSVLSLILSAPMVVASWINLQYFASTVDNSAFGSGDKMLHNRVGSIGVVAGNGHDLRTGLPLQSVQGPDGRWFHEPLRLQVFVEANTDSIDRVLEMQPGVRELVQNGWVRLFAIDPNGTSVRHRRAHASWQPVVDADAAQAHADALACG